MIHPGSMITGEIEAAGMSIEEAADFADLTRDTLTQVVSGNAPVTPEIAGQLSLCSEPNLPNFCFAGRTATSPWNSDTDALD